MFGFGKKTMFDNVVEKEMKWEGKKLTLQTGKIARQAGGAVLATYGETIVLATVCAAKEAAPNQGFFPLTVNYQEKFASGGKIPGSFKRREGQPSTDETLTSRLIDRPIRPLFPETFKNEVQVIATVFNYDKENRPDIVAMVAVSAALAVSGVPFAGPIGGARVGFKDGKYMVNPTLAEQAESELDLIVAGTSEGVLMVESEANMLSEDIMLGAVKAGFDSFQPVIKMIEELAKKAGKERWETPVRPAACDAVLSWLKGSVQSELEKAFTVKDKLERQEAVKAVKEKAKANYAEDSEEAAVVSSVFEDYTAEIMRGTVLEGKPRIDGRKPSDIRPIECEVGLFNRNHGSALFTRGETQAIVTATIGVKDDEALIDDLNGISYDHFMLHYNFPPYSVGEIKRMGSPARREIGHGKLAWRANHAVMPSHEEFPYTIRIVADVTESNGSSSMATTCGASLALMDAGIPVKAPIAGIAMGLIKEGEKFVILSDIMGDEDHLGDMDFKVAGSKEGITALQMDLKITSINFDIMKKALEQAREGRLHILGKMADAIKAPRKELSQYAPTIKSIEIPPKKIREVIGSGGCVIREIQEKTGTKIDIEDSGKVNVSGTSAESIEAALAIIHDIVDDPEVGKVFTGKVVRIMDMGAIVEFGRHDGMVHISELSKERVAKVEDAVKLGDEVKVLLMESKEGKNKLSMKRVK